MNITCWQVAAIAVHSHTTSFNEFSQKAGIRKLYTQAIRIYWTAGSELEWCLPACAFVAFLPRSSLFARCQWGLFLPLFFNHASILYSKSCAWDLSFPQSYQRTFPSPSPPTRALFHYWQSPSKQSTAPSSPAPAPCHVVPAVPDGPTPPEPSPC